MSEHDSGEGRLVLLEADQRTFTVDYDLKVESNVSGSSGTFDPPRVLRRQFLRITPRNNESVPDGDFSLKTNNEILRVRRSHGQWSVVEP
jgi:hypothetical protein